MSDDETVLKDPWPELAEMLGNRLCRALYWYPGSMGASAEPEERVDSRMPVHTADIGVTLGTGAGVLSVCWRMDGSDEWLGIDPPWASNEALPDYWVVDATASWHQRGLIGAALSDVALIRYGTGDIRSAGDVVGLVLTCGRSEVAIALGEFDSGQLMNTADTVAVVFSPDDFAAYARRSGWQRHGLPIARPRDCGQ